MMDMIYCEPTERGIHSFFLLTGGQEYYLFRQSYRKGVQNYFSKGVSINESIDFSRAHRDSSVMRTMSKIPMYIKYIEKEYEIEVFKQTKKRNNKASRVKEMRCA